MYGKEVAGLLNNVARLLRLGDDVTDTFISARNKMSLKDRQELEWNLIFIRDWINKRIGLQ